MKNKLKYGLTLAALTFLVGCSNKESIQRPSIGSGSTVQDSSSIINSKTSTSDSNNSSGSDDSSDISNSESTSEIDPVELSSYQYYPLPDKTLAIAVGNNKYLEKLTLPEQYQGRKVTRIVENGFKDCRALKEIGIPSSVLTIGNHAFYGCSALASINIPESVTAIGDSAFYGCSALASINIPEGVTSIGRYAFDGCSSLTICCQAQSNPSGWDKDWNPSYRPVVWGCIRAGNQDCFEYAVSSIEGVESATITGYAGSDTSITVPETIGGVKVTAIANSAFRGCASLTGIVIPESVTTIEDLAFEGCSALASIVIPNGVTSIGRYAFDGCSSLTICCQAQSKPSGWSDSWNYSNCPVVWGYSGNGTSGSLNYRIDNKNGEESIKGFIAD